MPVGCESIKIEFDEAGAALVTGRRTSGGFQDVVLSEDALMASGMLLTLVSYQVITLNRKYSEQGEDAVRIALERLSASLRVAGLAVGLLTEALDDSLTVYK
jgi:hypothetical protein